MSNDVKVTVETDKNGTTVKTEEKTVVHASPPVARPLNMPEPTKPGEAWVPTTTTTKDPK